MQQRTKSRTIKFPKIQSDANTLGVSRVALYKVLTGDPTFKSLKTLRKRYAALFNKKPQREREFILPNIKDKELKQLILKA